MFILSKLCISSADRVRYLEFKNYIVFAKSTDKVLLYLWLSFIYTEYLVIDDAVSDSGFLDRRVERKLRSS